MRPLTAAAPVPGPCPRQPRFLVAAPVLGLLTLLAGPVRAKIPAVIFAGDSPGARAMKTQVRLDRRLEAATLERARLIWVIDRTPAPGTWTRILARVEQGAGLVLVPGPKAPDLAALGLKAAGALISPVSLTAPPGRDVHLTRQVVWPTAPQVSRRWRLERLPGCSLEATVIEHQGGFPVLLQGRRGQGRVAVFSLQLAHPANRQIRLWLYFNYLLHVLSSRASATAPHTYAEWPASPVPGSRTLWILLAGLAVAWTLTLGLFIKVRRYSLRNPQVLDTFFADAARARPPKPAGGATPRAALGPPGNWRSIGFSRSLAGFLTLAGTLFVLFAPYYYVTNILIPNDVQPFPQAKGIWGFAWEALQIAWFLFDAGTYVAFVKYFAEYRIKEPKEALKSAQFFVWWQMLTGLVQVTMATVVAVVFLPHTPYGYSSNFVILVALAQYPGIFAVMNFFFQAYQRYDYNIGLDLLSDWVLRFGLQIPFVLLFRSWGAANPEYGEAFGAAVGIGLGYYFSQVVTFGLGVVLYKRLGLRLGPLFMAHFDMKTMRRMLSYGLKVVAGKVFFRAAKFIDRLVISLLLINYTEWLGLEGQIHYNLMFLFPIAYRFFETAMAALSESHGNGKQVLTQYYLVRFFQVGSLYTAIGLSLFLALGPLFVREAMDPQWARAADYMIIAAVTGAFSAAAWLSDMLQKGAGRPGLFAVILGVEQALRILLFLVLIPRFQFWGFYLALLITIAMKVSAAWVINHRLIVRVRVYYWQMLAAPALAGLVNYLLLRLMVDVLGLAGRWEVILFFFGSALLSFFTCFFVTGLVGGMDAAMAAEMEQASRMTGILRPITRMFYHASRAGWSLSPLHDRFPVVIHSEAMAEAHQLEEARRQNERSSPPSGP